MAAIGDIHHDQRLFRHENQHHHYSSTADRYRYLNKIKRGSYGVVRRALDKETGEIVAIKEEFHGLSDSTTREICLLQSLPHHPSIVEFRNAYLDDDDQDRVFIVMEYIDNDLHRFMATKPRPFTMNEVKLAMRQILEGVAFLHGQRIMHRDIKPSNILVSNKNATMKLSDFGLSRHCRSESSAYSPRVCTQWYRAPELLIGTDVYSFAIDMWSVGCVMAELVLGYVLFPSESEMHQLKCINRTMEGNGRLLRAMASAAALFQGAPVLTPLGFDLLQRLLACDPSKRITAKEALNHAWFTEF